MTEVWLRAALWLGLALAPTLISIRLRIAAALSEIVVWTVAPLVANAFFVPRYLLPKVEAPSPAGQMPQGVAAVEPEG